MNDTDGHDRVQHLRGQFRRHLWLTASILVGVAVAAVTVGLEMGLAPWVSGGVAVFAGVAIMTYMAQGMAEKTIDASLAVTAAALSESEERYRQFSEAASDWLWEMDAELRFVYASARYYELSGLSEAQFVGRQHTDIAEIDPDNREVSEFVSQLENHQPFRNFIYSEPSHDAKLGWFRLRGTPIFDAGGEFQGYRGTGTDITAEVRAREEAVESTTRFLEAIENVSDGIAFWDANDNFVLCNRRFRDQAGQASTTLVRGTSYETYLRSIMQMVVPPIAAGRREAWIVRRIDEHRNPPNAVEVNREGRWLLIRDDRSPDGSIVTVTTDITGVKRREQELQQVIDTVPMLLGYVDKSGSYQLINRTFAEWFDIDRDDIRGRPLADVHDHRLFELLSPYVERALAGEEVRFEASIPYAGPGKIPGYRGNRQVEVIYTPDNLGDGRIGGCFFAANDVTERMLAAAQLHQSQKMEAIGQLTGGVAHDFNNLLAIIVGSLAMLEDRIDGERENKLVGSALRSARRGGELTQRLLAFGRRQTLQTEIADVNELVEAMTDMLQRTLGISVEIEVRLGTDVWTLDVDRGQLENALLNLAINARDAMPDGGRLIIETDNILLDQAYTEAVDDLHPGSFIMIAVSDNGKGMSMDVRERAVEPFFTTKETGQGSGLGLSMIYGFTKQSGGHMRIYSEPGQGTVVRLYLPASEAEKTETERTVSTIDRQKSRGERILVIEDDEDVRVTTTGLLKRMGYRVIEAETGRQAIDLTEAGEAFDMVFSDVFLKGGMNGPDAVQEIKRLRPEVPVLFTSGYSADHLTENGSLGENVQMLAKPFELAELAARLRECLDEAAGAGGGSSSASSDFETSGLPA